jgi:hypothetical protein
MCFPKFYHLTEVKYIESLIFNRRYLDVVDDQVVGVQTLELGVGLCVLQQVEQKLCGLLRPTTLSCSVDLGLKKVLSVAEKI